MAQGPLLGDDSPLSIDENQPTFCTRSPAVLPRPVAPPPASADLLAAAARSFQEFRQRHNAPDAQALDRWCTAFAGRSEHAQLFCDLHRYDPQAADRLAAAVANMPDVGTDFLGFRLRAELGRGAFARVYLAQQGDLAGRPVVVKVAADVWGEVHALAQLQHPNIVPVYSVHRRGPFQAVCMPFQGSTTLEEVLQDVQSRPALPRSGKAVVEVIRQRRSSIVLPTTAESVAAAGPPRPGSGAIAVNPAALLVKLSYVDAILWLSARLADGLAHAHEHGIVHHDLKPANVLLTDQGLPILLDFNVAEELNQRAGPTAAWIAGTLLYMAPEQLAGVQGKPVPADGRCDLYSFGVLMFELLTGRYPFPDSGAASPPTVEQLLVERQVSPPRLRPLNPAVTPALEAIVRRCLEPDPRRRYQTARELQEDLDRQRTHRPLRHTTEPSLEERLRKWVRRHPRLTSAGLVALFACALLAALGLLVHAREQQRTQQVRQEQEAALRRQEREEALTARQRFDEERKTALFLLYTRTNEPEQLDNGLTLGLGILERYDVLENEAWQQSPLVQALPEAERQQLGDTMAELLLLLARAIHLRQRDGAAPGHGPLENALVMNERAAACSSEAAASPILWRQRGQLCALLGRETEAAECRSKAETLPLRTAQDHYWQASDYIARNRLKEALPLLQQARRLEPQNFWAWFVLANSYERLGLEARAEACYDACTALWPSFHWTYFNRALVHLRQKEYRPACDDFDEVIRLKPDLADAYLNRALARQGLNQFEAAEQDLTAALERDGATTRLYFLRAGVRDKRGDRAGSRRDYEEGMRREPADEKSWLARGFARLNSDPRAALADFEQALRLNPRSASALQNKAHVLAEKLGRNQDALAVLNRAVEWYPDAAPSRGGRGVLHARLGQRSAALLDAEETLLRDPTPPRQYQVACIYALTSADHPDDRLRAFQLLSSALRAGYGFNFLESDPDLDPIRGQPEFRRLVEAARALQPKNPPAKGK